MVSQLNNNYSGYVADLVCKSYYFPMEVLTLPTAHIL